MRNSINRSAPVHAFYDRTPLQLQSDEIMRLSLKSATKMTLGLLQLVGAVWLAYGFMLQNAYPPEWGDYALLTIMGLLAVTLIGEALLQYRSVLDLSDQLHRETRRAHLRRLDKQSLLRDLGATAHH